VIGYLSYPHELLIERPDLVEVSSRVTMEQLAELLGLVPDIQILDVRNPGETALGTLVGAQVIPLAMLVDSFDQLDRHAPVVVNCAGGTRSMIAASLLRHAGFDDVSDLIGGYSAWTAAGLPVARRGVAPAMAIEVTPAAAADLVTAGAVVIDVREPDEWSAGHVPDSVLIPMSQVEARLPEIAPERVALIVCRSGGRSNAVAQVLSARGIDAVNLAGGMHSWEREGLPVVTDSGDPGNVI